MAWDLEGLIAGLLVLISCAGEQGCPVTELADAIRQRIGASPDDSQQPHRGAEIVDNECGTSLRATSTVWRWLVQRPDVSIGPNRKYNHLSLEDILARSWRTNPNGEGDARDILSGDRIDAPTNDSRRSESPPQGFVPEDMRAIASEDTMWESITGHGVDHKRIPRSEWLCLLGIASTKGNGILQGDLGRLVDQDKRSVPKRTDALFKKGYITKRTTLVRGTKTSKLWLARFAPALIKEGEGTGGPTTTGMDLSPAFLTANLDPVPWHTRWTGESVDYIALATTVLAVAKAWGVIRILDMKSKLGVLSMRWQMRVISKTCRFLSGRGIIQYVAARLDEKVFKDCIKYVREMNTQDWTMYLATGKRGSTEVVDSSAHLNASPSLMAARPRWTLDEPLPQYVVRTARTLNPWGFTNPDIYFLALGPSFSRFISSLTSTMATSTVQPRHLEHLQLKSEHARAGKVASYRYFVQPDTTSRALSGSIKDQGSPGAGYGFPPFASKTREIDGTVSLSDICGRTISKHGRRGRPWVPRVGTPETGHPQHIEHEQTLEEPQLGQPDEDRLSSPRLMVTFKVPAEALKALMESINHQESPRATPATHGIDPGQIAVDDEQGMVDSGVVHQKATLTSATGNPIPNVDGEDKSDFKNPPIDLQSEEIMEDQDFAENKLAHETTAEEPAIRPAEPPSDAGDGDVPVRGRGRPRGDGRGGGRARGRGRGRGRGRPPGGAGGPEASETKPYKCEKCGGSWKNDLGLKYHLEKSKTSCNPSYDPNFITPRSTGRTRIEAVLESTTVEPAIAQDRQQQAEAEQDHEQSEDDDKRPADMNETPRLKKTHNRPGGASETPLPKSNATGNYSQKISGPRRPQTRKPQGRSAFSAPQAVQEVVLLGERMHTHKLSDLSQQWNRAPLASSTVNTEVDVDPPLPRETKELEHKEAGMGAEVLSNRVNDPFEELGLHQDRSAVPDLIEPSSQDQKLPDAPTVKTISRPERNQRVGTLIDIMLAENSGVFPGGEALWRTLRVAWDKEYPLETSPTTKEFQAALKSLISKNSVTEHCHAFRGQSGAFSKCQIITRPDVDAFSPKVIEVMDKIKAAYPKLYIPEWVVSPEGLGLQMEGAFVFSRRPLPSLVSVLDAPVYAAQIAAKRELEEAEDDGRERKRRPKGVKGQIRWVSNKRENPLEGVLTPIASPIGSSAGPHIHFLNPNTYMDEDEPPGYSIKELLRTGANPPENVENSLQQVNGKRVKRAVPPAGIVPSHFIRDSGIGAWPNLEARFFEDSSSSFTLQGWLPSSQWFSWAGIAQEIDKRVASKVSRRWFQVHGDNAYRQFVHRLRACVDVEMSWAEGFVHAPREVAGPHNIFIQFPGSPVDDLRVPGDLSWPDDGQLTLDSTGYVADDPDATDIGWSDEDIEIAVDPLFTRSIRKRGAGKRGRKIRRVHEPRKRVALACRRLTALPESVRSQAEESSDIPNQTDLIGDPDEVLAAIVAVRALLGGVDRSIDWGLLVHLFPDTGLDSLRKLWVTSRKYRSAYISKFTHDFRERFVTACEKDELPMINFDSPLDYDWAGLIKWTMEIPGQEDVKIPQTSARLDQKFILQDVKSDAEDWTERFFHYQASTFGRLDVATADPAAITVSPTESHTLPNNVDVARSWIRSLCCTSEMQYAPRDVKEALLRLVEDDSKKVASLLQTALEQLMQQKIIHKSLRPALGGRPYRFTEWYTSTLSRLSQWTKYQDAATFKTQLDEAYRQGKPFEIPYAATDGAMMALVNMSAHGRIELLPQDVPYIPFGFKPGNYESRKFPKSYYHFGLVAIPTGTYQYNEDIDSLNAVTREAPPTQGPRHTIPQWVGFFGQRDTKRWSEILGAVCFAYSTRGQMQVDALCSALRPVLENFEAKMVLDWGQKTGVLEESSFGQELTVGEWWWLAVPWQYQYLQH